MVSDEVRYSRPTKNFTDGRKVSDENKQTEKQIYAVRKHKCMYLQ